MILKRAFYRVRQFWNALVGRPAPGDLGLVRTLLSPDEMNIFLQMQPGEQVHSLVVMKKIQPAAWQSFGSAGAAVCIAALLHDAGKTRSPIHLLDRMIIVAGKKLLPARVEQWGRSSPRGWRRPFVVAAQHPEWGAQMAAAAGSLPLVVSLIRKHQNFSSISRVTIEDEMLQLLQQADEDS